MSERFDRRTFVRVTAAAVGTGALAGCIGENGIDPDDDVPSEIHDFLDGASVYDGSIADATGESEVRIDVGAGNGLAYDPAAVRVDAGTTVVWEWTGQGGSHDVAATDDADSSFQSDLMSAEGETFEHTFDEAGIHLYVCGPHRGQGMLGAIEVTDG